MKRVSEQVIMGLWSELAKEGLSYKTPDKNKGSYFTVEKSDETSISIRTAEKSPIYIHRDSFIAGVRFLLEGCHVSPEKACRIGANIGKPGSLDLVTRMHSKGTMVISYILPILEKTGIVGIDGERPNNTWVNV